MKQVLAIFRKDAVRFWPEILVSFGLLAALAILYPEQWHRPIYRVVSYGPFGLTSHSSQFSTTALLVLIPISWWVLVTRLVHAERLVGHTQFWLTRPYEWPLLLCAKALFVAVFVDLPFLVAQLILLREAGFHPLSHLAGMVDNLFLVTVALVLPVAALAVVTSSFARMTLAVLGVVIFIAGMAVLSSALPGIGGTPDLIGGDVALALLVCSLGAAVVVQYATRRLRTAWLLLGCAALLLVAGSLLDPDQALMNRYYAATAGGGAPGVQMSFAADEMKRPEAHSTEHKDIYEVTIPVAVSGVPTGSAAIPTAVRVALDGREGSRWESPWQAGFVRQYFTGSADTVFRFRIRRQVFEQFRSGPVHLHLSFAIDQARVVRRSTIPLPEGAFEVPGVGICAPEVPWTGQPINGLRCRSALRLPELTDVTVAWDVNDCHPVNSAASHGPVTGEGWIGSLDRSPAEFSLTSVLDVPVGLSNDVDLSEQEDNRRYRMRQLCLRSPVSFTTYALAGRTRVEFDVPEFRLPELTNAPMF